MQCSLSHVACRAAFRPAGEACGTWRQAIRTHGPLTARPSAVAGVGRLTIKRGVVCMVGSQRRCRRRRRRRCRLPSLNAAAQPVAQGSCPCQHTARYVVPSWCPGHLPSAGLLPPTGRPALPSLLPPRRRTHAAWPRWPSRLSGRWATCSSQTRQVGVGMGGGHPMRSFRMTSCAAWPRLGACMHSKGCLRLPCTARAQPAIQHQHQRGCPKPPPASASRPCPQILQAAVCPERRRGFDGALSALASVTEVRISNDLQVAKVYLSIYRWAAAAGGAGLAVVALGGRLFDGSAAAFWAVGCHPRPFLVCPCQTIRTAPCRSDDVGKAAAMEGLQKLEGYVRRHIGKQVRLMAQRCHLSLRCHPVNTPRCHPPPHPHRKHLLCCRAGWASARRDTGRPSQSPLPALPPLPLPRSGCG